MNNFINLQNYSKAISIMAVYTIVLSIVVSTTISNGYAAPKDPRYDRGSCEDYIDKKTGKLMRECCWREPVPGQILANTYCQSCEVAGPNCGDKELQMDLVKIPESARPSNDDQVVEDPTTKQPSSTTSNPGVIVREPLQQIEPANTDGDEIEGDFSENTPSNSEGIDSTFNQQESDGSTNFQELSDSNQSE